jgi:hypothetical protein
MLSVLSVSIVRTDPFFFFSLSFAKIRARYFGRQFAIRSSTSA